MFGVGGDRSTPRGYFYDKTSFQGYSYEQELKTLQTSKYPARQDIIFLEAEGGCTMCVIPGF